MKKAILVALVCLNAALAAVLVFQAAAPAHAQVIGGGSNYVVVTGPIGTNTDALYVLDLASRRLRGFYFDRNAKKLVPTADGRDMKRDFGRPAPN